MSGTKRILSGGRDGWRRVSEMRKAVKDKSTSSSIRRLPPGTLAGTLALPTSDLTLLDDI